MTLQCLEPYQDQQEVAEIIEKGIQILSAGQEENGGYVAYGSDSSESVSQVILTLSTYGIDCNEDERFIKDGKGLYDILMELSLIHIWANVEKYLKENDGILSDHKYTEYSRVVLALKSIGAAPTDIGGYDVQKPLEDFDTVTAQGLNGAVFALLALNADCLLYTSRCV